MENSGQLARDVYEFNVKLVLRMKRYTGAVEYATVPTFFKLRTKQVVVKGQTDEHWNIAYTIMGVISILLGCAIGFDAMF